MYFKKLDKSNIQDILGLTPMQEGMLFHYLSNSESKQYLEQLCLTLCGEINENLIKMAWNHVAQNNEILRTIFKWDKLDKPLQIILKQYEIPYNTYDLSNINSVDKTMQIMDIRDNELNKKINISENPLRMAIVKLDSSKFEIIITYHHILYDGWSNGIILKEFVQACNCLCADKPLSIIKKNSFKEFIKYCQKQDKAKQETFWREHFNNYESKSTIWTKPSYSEISVANSKIDYKLNNKISESMYEFCKKQKTTVAALLYTAWGILLQKYNNTNDIVFGTTVSGRNAHIQGIEDMVGLFINTLPLRVNSSEEKNIQSLLKKVDSILKEREEYQSTPLVDIKSYSRVDSKEELFDTLVVFENYPLDQAMLNGDNHIRIEEYSMTEMTNYKLTLTLTDFKGLELQFKYDSSIFDDTEINRMVKHFENIIINIMENEGCSIGQIDMLTKEERQQILVDFNNTKADYPKDKTIHQLFEEQVERTPYSIALMYEDRSLTYRELNEKANQLARVLRGKGVVSDRIVGIMIERSLEMIVGIIGILKAGCAYLPIDPEYPKDRIEYMLQDSETSILLTQSSIKDKVEFSGEIIELEDERLYKGNTSNIESNRKPQDTAYVIYTSGSTGKPKGVMIEDHSVVNFITGMTENIDFTSEKIILAVTSISFDIFGLETLLPLTKGLRIVIADESSQKDINKLSEIIHNQKVDIIQSTPSRMRLLSENSDNNIFYNLKEMIIGGELLPQSLLEKLRSNTKANIYNVYGPTETTIWSTVRKLSEGQIDIGKPIANTKVYIVDKHSNIVPVGVAGELCIAGEGLARGYLNRPELTAEKFVDNPFEQGTRMYRTGDLVRWLPDGNIEFLGRIDYQVKIRGYRIELGEIENKLLSYEAVKETVVIARDNNSGSKYLCAYVVGEKELTILELREHLSNSLPGYMIPSYFIQLEKLPLTPNGKVDRKALPEPDGNISTGTEYEAPRSSAEEKLVEIWREVLGVERIGINDNFFGLGGHSLKATSLASKIHKIMNVEVPLKEIFTNPTIKGISEYIKDSEENIYSSIEPAEEKEYYEMSSAQKRIYTLQQLEPNSTSYNMPGILELDGELDTERLKEAFNKLIQRHEALITSFEVLEEGLIQKVHSNVEFSIEEYKTEEDKGIEEIVKGFIRTFDLSKAPLLRVGIIKIQPNKNILMYDMHHIISDGTSMGILVREFSKAYAGEELTPLRIQYKDFSEWENELFKSDKIKAQQEYWLKQFEGEIPVLNLTTDYQRPALQSFEGASIQFEIKEELTNKLRQMAKATGSTMYMVLLSTFNILLSKYSGQEDIVVGIPIAGRPHADLENIIGMFVNTLAMRNYPTGEKTFIDFLTEVKNNALGAYENQDYQFEELVEKLAVARDFSRNPVFDVMLVLQNMNIAEVTVEDLKISPYKLENMVSKFDITLTAVELKNSISIGIQYCTKLFSKAAIMRMYKHLENIIQAVTENIDIKLSEVEILTAEEKQKILIDFNNTKVDYPKDKTIHQLFEEQVERTPNNIAVLYEDKQLTYRELNEKANQLAGVLRNKGVVADSIVGIMANRSLEMVIGIMGILKAGGAYLPIDPYYPKERVDYMLQDSGAKLLLIQKHLKDCVSNSIDTINIDEASIYEGDNKNLEIITELNNLAYVIYTSGSTGKPKGVMIEHRNIYNSICSLMKEYRLSQNDSILHVISFAFDGFVTTFFTPILSGAKVVFMKDEDSKNPILIKEHIKRYGITRLTSVPTLYSALLEASDKEDLETLRIVTLAGENTSESLIKKSKNIMPDVEIINEYGPTENSVVTTISRDIQAGKKVTIGKPIANTKVYIVDKNNKLQPIGVPGELCISGEGLARGYLNNLGLTVEKFVDSPFEQETRMYHTGDLARWLPDGNIEYLGRIDHQVKIRGFRVELGEIENKLLGYEAVKETVVIARADDSGNNYLCAYVVGARQLKVPEIIEHLTKELPNYMIPSYFIQLEKLPLTQNGKLDRKALPKPDGNILTGTEYEAPRNSAEQKLVEIWREVLGVEKIGINDNFFGIGGHSLKATSLASKIHKIMNVEVPLKEIFTNPTIKGISEYIKDSVESIYSSIEPVEEKEYYEMSSAQNRIYTLQQLELNSTSYNMPGVLELKGDLDAERLKEAFNKLIQRHESLRTSFEVINEGLMQKVHKKIEFDIEQYRVESKEEITDIVKNFIRAFDLSKAPLLRVGLIKVQSNEYILMFDMHHIISDGVSMGILVEEFSKAYAGEELTSLRIQYKDFSEWQNELFRSESIKVQEEYWLKQFEGEIPVLNLTTDYQRPAVQSFEGDSIQLEIDKELTNKLRQISKATGSTMYMVLLSTFNILLSKYSGQEDIIVGSPIAGRPHEDLGNIIGMFVNTLAMRNYPNGEKTFKEFLKEVKENALGAYENQDYQFEELVEKLNVARDFSRNPLFDVMFTLQNMDMGEIAVAGIKIKPHNLENRISKFDMTVEAVELGNSIYINIQYCTKLFNRTTIERMYKHLENIIQAVTENIDTKLSEVDILTKEERQILIDFNNTKADYPKDKTIHQLFEEQVEKTPDNIAVVYEEKSFTYRELNERANQLARVLRDKGVKSDSIVAIIVDRSLDMIVGIMSVLKSGGAYLPIDPEYPKDRIEYMLEDSEAIMLLTQKSVNTDISYSGEIIILDEYETCHEYKSNLEAIAEPDNLAYIIYTSGTTGKPKGAMIEHRNVVRLFFNDRVLFDFTDKDVWTMFHSYCFDFSVWEMYGALLYGGKLIVIPKLIARDTAEYLKVLEKEKVTVLNQTPSAFYRLAEEDEKVGKSELCIRYVIFGGEALMPGMLKRFYGKYPKTKLINMYGITETTVHVTYKEITEEDIRQNISNIGKPIPTLTAYIMDKNAKLLPIGVPGELCVGGEGVCRGYLRRPELTAEKFIANMFAQNPLETGEKLYRSGDLVRMLSDGNMEYLGRIDHQVKIRGFRIELGEIENKLLNHEVVKEAMVIARGDNSGSKYLCAYIVVEREQTVAELREYLLKELPEYMIPTYFIQLDKLPLTVNGKVDRKALPEPNGRIVTGAEYEAPRNITEEKLIDIWREVLGVERIGINDNFFELGGHSLKATSLVAKIHKVLNIEVPLREIFKASTVKGVSEYIKSSEESIYSSIEPIEEKDYYEMSSSQKRMYTLQQFDLNSISYNMPGVLELEGDLDIEYLKEVFDNLIQRHEVLRTSFNVVEEGLIQKVHKKVEFDIEEYKVEEEKGIEEIVKGFIRTFNLLMAPLLRVGLVKTLSNKHILMFDMHHIISDGVSMGILVEEFSKIYAGEKLTPLRIQYKDFSEWQNELFNSDKIKTQEEYWLKQFEGEIPVLNLPIDYQRPTIQSFEGASLQFEITEELTMKLKQIVKATGATMYMVLLSTFNILLSKYSGQEDIIVGSPIAGRPHADLENIIGMFVNTLVMRNYPTGERAFKEFLLEVKDNALKAYENQDYQFEELVEKLNVTRELSRNPVFDVMFVLQNMENNETVVEGIKIKSYKFENSISKFDITMNAVELKSGISICIQYCTKLFNQATIERMYKHLENIIQAVTENIDIKLSELELLTKDERQQILIDFNNTKADYPKEKTIHKLFEEQVEKTPDNIAVVYEEKSFTYRELNERANQLARILRDKGVKSDSIVAIMVEKSLDMIVGIMSVLKSGGAYLPIDPEYPKDRIEYMLEDSEAIMLLTQKSVNTDISYSGEIIILDEYETCHEYKSNLEAIAEPDNLAYIIYTSGTTGKPKGAMIEHRNVVRLFFNDRVLFDFTDKDVWTMFHSYCFDFSVWEMYGALLYGGKLIVIPKLIARDTAEYLKVLEKEKVTVLNQTPSAFYRLAEEDEKVGKSELCIRYVIFGGEALMPGMLKRFYGKYPKTKLINMYGITETTVHVTYKEITEEDIRQNISNIGKPIPTLTAYIMDKNAKLLPIGVPGELCVGGEGVCRGYLRRPELTAEKFIANMFAHNPLETGEKLYRSGDLVRMLLDGNMEYLGRIDQQVKIRGHRIELGEIESRLLKYEGIKETIVIARKDEEQNNYLCAYIVLDKEQNQDKSLTVTELRQHLDKELPDYMIPSYFIQLEKLPLTTNGKVDRKALPEPDGSIFTGAEYEAPRNSTEEKLVEIWREVLRVEKIGINDNFFELGGHSLKAINLAAKIQKALEAEVSIGEILRNPTIKEISKVILERKNNKFEVIKPTAEREYYPVSSSQKRLYILNQLDENNVSYNMPSLMSIEGGIDIHKFEQVFNLLIRRHEALRTSFEYIDGEIVQKIHNIKDMPYFKITYDESLIDTEKLEIEYIKPFDLTKAPLFRVALIKRDSNKYLFILDMHHIISDGISINIMVNEFMKLYVGEELPLLEIQYRDYVVWETELYQNDHKKLQEKYWLSKLEGLSNCELPITKLSKKINNMGSVVNLILDEQIVNKIDKYCKKNRITKFTFILTVFKILLFGEINQTDICIGTPIAGRRYSGLEHIIGVFLNVQMLRTKVQNKLTFTEYMKIVDETVLEAQDNQDYPYEELYAKFKDMFNYKGDSLFNIMLNYMPYQESSDISIEGLSIKPIKGDKHSVKYSITLYVNELVDKLVLSLDYNDSLYSEESMEKILNNMKNIINIVLENENILIENIGTVIYGALDDADINIENKINDSDFDNDDFF